MTEFARSSFVPRLEARRSCQENSCYRPHSHDVLSIGVIESGESRFRGTSGKSVTLLPGDIVVVPAHQVHQCNPDRGRWRYRMLHMDEQWAAEVGGDAAATLLTGGVQVVRSERVTRAVLEWSELIFVDASAEVIEAGLGPLLQLITQAVPDQAASPPLESSRLAQLAPALNRLRLDDANPTLDELAELMGMSRFQFARAVKSATGLAPLAWRQNARVSIARGLLVEGRTIADTAHALGYVDQSHFHRAFRAHVAASPGVYRVTR